MATGEARASNQRWALIPAQALAFDKAISAGAGRQPRGLSIPAEALAT